MRYVHGWGQFQKDLGIIGLGLASPASRLTYESTDMNGAEGFARIDTSFGLMLKGLVGGASGGGHMNDEDWGLPFAVFVPYSNTISSVDDRIRYWTVDVGYNWRRGATYTVAPFVGYSQLRQDMKGLGCTQIANPFSDCNPPSRPACSSSPRMTPGIRCAWDWPSMSRWRRACRCRARRPICPM